MQNTKQTNNQALPMKQRVYDTGCEIRGSQATFYQKDPANTNSFVTDVLAATEFLTDSDTSCEHLLLRESADKRMTVPERKEDDTSSVPTLPLEVCN